MDDSLILNKTVDLMLSDNWKDRLVAEYMQTKIRYDKLATTISTMNMDVLGDDVPIKQSYHTLVMQRDAMNIYLKALEIRSLNYGIDLEKEGKSIV